MAKIIPWNHSVPISEDSGKPTVEFMRWLSQQLQTNQEITSATPQARSIITEGGLQGGGDLTADRTLSLTNSGVTAGSYGSGTLAPQITIDAKGRVISALNIPISGGGGGGSEYPVPMAADFTISSSSNSDVLTLADKTKGLSILWGGDFVNGGQGQFKMLPSATDWEVKTYLIFNSSQSYYFGGGVCVRDSSANVDLSYTFVTFAAIRKFTKIGQSNSTSLILNTDVYPAILQELQIKIAYTYSTNTIVFWVSSDGENWIYVDQAIGFLASPNQIGFKLFGFASGTSANIKHSLFVKRWEQSW